jgi:phospholipid/cholesterol/gamma-HCH transport system substrate-binding protein
MTDAVNQQILPVKQKAEQLMASLDSLVNQLNSTLGKGQIDATLGSFKTTMGNLETTSKTINNLANAEANQLAAIVSNVKNITTALEQNKNNFTAIAQNLHNITDTLAKARFTETISSLATASAELSGITTKINSGEGSLGLLLKDKTVYNNVEIATQSLNNLLSDLKQNPKRYVHFSLIERKNKENKNKEDKQP